VVGSSPISDKQNAQYYVADPVLLLLGAAGLVLAAIKKDFLQLLWVISYIIFLYLIGWVILFHWIPALPAFCISAATLIEDLSKKVRTKEIQQTFLTFAIISAIGVFGLISTTILITTNFSSSEFEAAAFVIQVTPNNSHVGSNNNNKNNDDITIISSPIYSWIFKYIFNKAHVFSHIRDSSQPITKKVLLIVDGVYKSLLSQKSAEDKRQIEQIQMIYNNTKTTATFEKDQDYYNFNKRYYPYTSIIRYSWAGEIKIRKNF
jgi:hypothetical protein